MSEDVQLRICSDADIIAARQKGRALAISLGFSPGEATLIATAISELTRNIVTYAQQGELILKTACDRGIVVIARDEGPGIACLERALQGGYSTSGSLGLGLSGVRRMMDEFEIISDLGDGTTVTIKKWKK